MQDLSKVSSLRLYLLLKNFAIDMLILVFAMAGSKYLPDYLSPVLTLGCAAYVYYRIMSDRMHHKESCTIVDYTVFLGLIIFTFFVVILNILFSFDLLKLPPEMVFLSSPFIPSLLMMPILFFTAIYVNMRRYKLSMCLSCQVSNGDSLERGRTGSLIGQESRFQMRNMILVFGLISAMIWAYYLFIYINISTSARDWYVFTWLVIITILLDVGYMMGHYYSISQALEDKGLLVDLETIASMPKQTYLRYYVICGEYMLIQENLTSQYDSFDDHIDTPVTGVLNAKPINDFDAEEYFKHKVGFVPGELRFFYGHDYNDFKGVSMKRYFYFLDGNPEDYKELADKFNSEWVHFDEIKEVYSTRPRVLKRMFLADMNRMATIMVTQKMFDEDGKRKFKIKAYHPSFTLEEVKNNNVDFQSDKWMKIAVYNSDILSFRFNNWFRKKKSSKRLSSWTLM